MWWYMSHTALLNVTKFCKMIIMKAVGFFTTVGEYCMGNLCCHVIVISSNDQQWPLESSVSILYSTSDDKVIISFIPPLGWNGAFLHRSVLLSVFSIVCPPVPFWIPCYNSRLPWLLLHVVENTKQVKFNVGVYSFYGY
jgi:hypothetical protein